MVQRRKKRDPLRPPELSLPALRPAGDGELREGTEHDGLHFADLDPGDHTAGSQRFVECRFTSCRFGNLKLRHASFNTCRLEQLEATSIDVAEGVWSDVEFEGGRIGALLLPGGRLTRVRLRGVRANYVNLRGTEINDLQLQDCRIEELDLGGSSIRRADLAGSEVERLLLTDATLRDVDLRQAGLAVVESVGQLRGAIITEQQLVRLAPALALHVGIAVE